jgi:hypothetical protein
MLSALGIAGTEYWLLESQYAYLSLFAALRALIKHHVSGSEDSLLQHHGSSENDNHECRTEV